MEDPELLAAWGGGDLGAGEALFERHFEPVARFFRNKLGGVSEGADDLIQQTFLGAVEGRARFRGESSFRTYLFGVARNVLLKHYRQRHQDGARHVDFQLTALHDLDPSPSAVLARDHEHRLLLHGLRRIPLESQIALELHYWEGFTAREVGDALELPLGTAKTWIRRAKQQLCEQIALLSSGAMTADETEAGLETWARALRDRLFDAA